MPSSILRNKTYDLAQLLQRQFLLKHEDILKVMKHILYYNKHTEIDTVGQEDERKFMIYLRPRFKHNVVHPYSILKYEYYDQMKKVRGEQSLVW